MDEKDLQIQTLIAQLTKEKLKRVETQKLLDDALLELSKYRKVEHSTGGEA